MPTPPRSVKPLYTISIIICSISLLFECKSEERTDNASEVDIVVDSSYFTMNPMDLQFDTAEMAMIK